MLEHDLGAAPAEPELPADRHGQGQLDDPVVEERAAAFQAVGHAGEVDLDQEVAGQIGQEVDDRGPGHRVAPGGGVEGPGQDGGGVGLGGWRAAARARWSRKSSRIEGSPGGLVEHRDPAEVAGLGRLADPFEHPADLAEPGLGPDRGGQGAGDRPAEEPPGGAGQPVEPGGQGDGPVAVVAGEELVAGVAGQGDGDVLAGLAGDVPGRQGRAVGERLVELRGQRRGGSPRPAARR